MRFYAGTDSFFCYRFVHLNVIIHFLCSFVTHSPILSIVIPTSVFFFSSFFVLIRRLSLTLQQNGNEMTPAIPSTTRAITSGSPKKSVAPVAGADREVLNADDKLDFSAIPLR